jgi:hypothetical protein
MLLLGHPVSLHLHRLLPRLAQNWMSTNEEDLLVERTLDLTAAPTDTVTTNVQDPDVPGMAYIPAADQLPNETQDEGDISVAANVVPLTVGTVAEMTAGWAPGLITQRWNETLRRVPYLYTLEDGEQATELRRTVQIWVTNTRDTRLQRAIERGDFVPLEDETHNEQLMRFQREINMARVRRSHRPEAQRLTCVYCNDIIHKTLTASGKVHVPTQSQGCPNPPSLMLGWSVIRGEYDGIFPDQNLFVLFSRAQVPGTVLNQMQLARQVAVFCNDNDWHPQVRDLTDVRYYRSWGAVIQLYVAGQNPGAVKSGWITGVKEAMMKVARTEPLTIVDRQKTRAEGFRASRSQSTNTMSVYAFQLSNASRDQILRLEQQ